MGKRDSLLLTLLLLPLHADVQVLADIEVRSDRLSGSDTLIRGDTFLSAAPMQQQIRVEKALQVAGTNGDPVKALQSLAGVVSTGNDNASEIYIHGAKPRETYYNLNHLPLGY
ncbi:MAG TPA: hypothetical protein ENK72_02665, partial [Epsilonproteobacteria bacterium]|nr:hypothetical protein [Campylobacterota bacterium]